MLKIELNILMNITLLHFLSTNIHEPKNSTLKTEELIKLSTHGNINQEQCAFSIPSRRQICVETKDSKQK